MGEGLRRARATTRATRATAPQEAHVRYCATCHHAGNDDSRLGRDRVWNVEGAGPDGIEADVCEAAGHVFPVNSDEEEGN